MEFSFQILIISQKLIPNNSVANFTIQARSTFFRTCREHAKEAISSAFFFKPEYEILCEIREKFDTCGCGCLARTRSSPAEGG